MFWMYILISVPMMEVEEYLQVDFAHLMLKVVEPRMIDDDEHFSKYVHHENSRMDYHEHSIIDSRNKFSDKFEVFHIPMIDFVFFFQFLLLFDHVDHVLVFLYWYSSNPDLILYVEEDLFHIFDVLQ